uniref:Integrase n=1 Tax=Angiostrongylus cantonensis TaxID=6313 RepID=A0A0K0D6A3_ANGCA
MRKQDEGSLSVVGRAIERTMLGVSGVTQVKQLIRSSDLRQRSTIKDTILYAEPSKIRWARHIMRMNDSQWTSAVSDWIPRDVKRTARRPPTRWSELFTKGLEELNESLEQAQPIGLLLHVTREIGRFTGARSSYSTINGTTVDTVELLGQ